MRPWASVALTVSLYSVFDSRPLTWPEKLVRPAGLCVEPTQDPSGAMSFATPKKIRAGVSVRTLTLERPGVGPERARS